MEVESQQTNGKQEEHLDPLLSPELQETLPASNHDPVSVVVEIKTNGCLNPGASPPSPPLPCLGPLSAEQLSAVLHATMPPASIASIASIPSIPSISSSSEPLRSSRSPAAATPSPATLERLQVELRGLRDEMDMMKSQHNKEIKLLMNELDEEKRIRLTLQMEMQRMNKRMSKMS